MEILNRREQIGAKKLPPVIGDDVEKASKSKFGVVKIGNGINVSNGVISVAAGGVTCDELFNGSVSLGGTTLYDLAHPYTDYKFITLVTDSGSNTTAGGIMPVANLSTGLYNSNGTGNPNVTSIRFEAEDATKFSTPSGSGAYNVKIYGIK